ncbi:bifunctional 2-polyprenyl-6-hydroxyphenol methylase/3-demethylubiquinol 3-O-methyltransferase UbiG [Sphingomonas sp.]|uniref:bifunctional 2-polyprenyl-6-hydroxyphenol methylase/3-demethylubiquinol 3-O-methyltransferase UbiG n=1 Tax=Sphingomonas sp. TaxID=28214 RepID=UPI0025D46662|nr:bifunctional 2-polyprenyl-6-hydroxyphenol methylase/3-demethylubiquinol 3-O-methyltransferase UbiG [Sphingomonas sp.]MBV9527490.1 bifunctional 2-polyprenyl-6-hydroxyphenol methylase/3-demethylubiquinol 3-O-methyltransferase UbiG [Sphingomonas sp.]
MAQTSTSEGLTRETSSIVPEEVAQFGKLAADWWDPDGASAMLHKLNPVRLKYVRDQVDRHWQCDECDRRPLAGKTALDVGCGAGLLAEPLARLGAKVTAIDAAPEVIAVARNHAAAGGLQIDYRAGDVQQLDGRFDLITCMEVIEHVADPAAFVAALAKRLAPAGLLVMSTPNATGWSKLMMITIAEGIGRIPRGTHDFEKFIAPDRMKLLLADAGLTCIDVEGIAWSPSRGLHLSDDVRLNYLIAAATAS